ncbi:hypothetical protein QFZ49_005280 [Streptomyces turgidiscabies]|uniref:Uncharacterized protein n=1 Tax=Streptomyces turgidiscabies TaxID=85558 RepID=A0ABU0RUB2_9ACTN|nr:hypothetical protein [Streptomyces turgidiscabies]MDQ0935308.1 hypothetical protein [Streptomyces turgidiscabies]
MIDPFWYTSTSTGLRVDTGDEMDVDLNRGKDRLGTFTVDSPDTYRATVFVESTPLKVYRDYVGIVGKPLKSDAPYEQYAKPLWKSWAQFYTKVDQEKLLDYATDLHDSVTWTTVGIATPGGVAAVQGIGVFMTAANAWTGARGIATFEGFSVT